MKRTLSSVTSIVGIATLLYVGYIMVRAIPDVGRYIKMSTM